MRPLQGNDVTDFHQKGGDLWAWVRFILDQQRPQLLTIAPIPTCVSICRFPNFSDLYQRLNAALAGDSDAAPLVVQFEAAMEEALEVLAAATGCPDDEAEMLLAGWDVFVAHYDRAVDLVLWQQAHAEAMRRWPDAPPPMTPCRPFGTAEHHHFWRRLDQWDSGWICAICHPPPPDVEVATWEIPA